MNYIYQSQKVELHIDVYKGQSAVKEDFSRADLRVFLVRDLVRPLHEPIFDVSIDANGTACCKTQNLPVGVYRVKLMWSKNDGRSPMCAESKVLFSVTDIAEEATNSIAATAKLRMELHTSTYGKDGLDAYELAVFHGKTTLSEEQWLEQRNATDAQVLNEIMDGYARLRDEVNTQVNELTEDNSRLNENTSDTTERIENLERERSTYNGTFETLRNNTTNVNEALAEVATSIDSLAQRLQSVERTAFNAGKCKGMFLTKAAMLQLSNTPSVGDYCYLRPPISINQISAFNPAAYWGNAYLGSKETQTTWSEDVTPRSDGVVKIGANYYRIVQETSLQYIALEDNVTLLASDYLSQIEVSAYDDYDDIQFEVWVCETAGQWKFSHNTARSLVQGYVDADSVTEAGNTSKTQQHINDVNVVNALVVNRNLRVIATAIAALATKLNEIQRKAIYTDNVEYEELTGVSMAFLAADGVDNHRSLDFSTLPLILS